MLYVPRIPSKDFLFGFTFVFVEMFILYNLLFCFVKPSTWHFENSKQDIWRMQHETCPVKRAE